MISIKNLRNGKGNDVWDVKVDRTSVLGNKFYMSNESMRDDVCIKYEKWLNEQLRNRNEVIEKELKRLVEIYKEYGKLNLYCWCAPKRCHAESIKEVLKVLIK